MVVVIVMISRTSNRKSYMILHGKYLPKSITNIIGNHLIGIKHVMLVQDTKCSIYLDEFGWMWTSLESPVMTFMRVIQNEWSNRCNHKRWDFKFARHSIFPKTNLPEKLQKVDSDSSVGNGSCCISTTSSCSTLSNGDFSITLNLGITSLNSNCITVST